MAKFKKSNNKTYTTMSTYHLISISAGQSKSKTKGLLTQMLSLPDNWDYSEKGLTAINGKDGRTSIRSCLKDLEENGYLERQRERLEGNKLGKAIYIIYEKPKNLMDKVQIAEHSNKSQIFRIVKSSGYAFLSNYHLQDKNLSLSAKGILSQLLIMPEDWNITIDTLTRYNKDTTNSISKYVKELITAGYVICRGRERRKDGTFGETIYEVYEKPQITDLIRISPEPKNPTLENPTLENPTLENPTLENEPNKIILESNIIKSNIIESNIIQSINQSERRTDRLIDVSASSVSEEYEKYKDIIKDNIEYAIISKRAYIKENLDEIVNLMAETVAFNRKPIRINGSDIPAEIVKSRFLKINSQDIEYILETLSKNTVKIHNIRAYLLTTIYNAKNTIGNYYSAEVNHDLYGGGHNV